MLPIRVRVDQVAMARKGYSPSTKALGLGAASHKAAAVRATITYL